MKAGVREIRDRFTYYLDQVRHGREVIVTERGKEVAALVPRRKPESIEDAVQRLETEGLLERADSWRPLTTSRTRLRGRLLSSLVLKERAHSW